MAYLGPAFEAVRGANLFSQPGERESWPFAIQVRLPRLGVLGRMGTIDVDARTGEVLPLTHQQTKQIRAHADALVEFQTQSTTQTARRRVRCLRSTTPASWSTTI